MKITFLGTSAGAPTRERYMSAIVLHFRQSREWVLFDCAEGTQFSLMKTSLSLAALSHIFITHMHGDHLYGLPGLLSSRSLGGMQTALTLHGPIGIREYLETTMRLSQLNLGYPLHIHEIKETGETFTTGPFSVRALPMKHTMPTFGYILQEGSRPGTLDVDKLRQRGVPFGPLYGQLKKGENITLKDGRTLKGKEFVSPPLPGKRIAIGGDNAEPSLFLPYIQNADLFIHEATYTEACFEKLQRRYLHSTAKMVAEVAQNANVTTLALTHFSPRYTVKGGPEGMDALATEATEYFSGNLLLAEDFMEINL